MAGKREQGEPRAVFLRVPRQLKRFAEREARSEHLSVNQWFVRLLDSMRKHARQKEAK